MSKCPEVPENSREYAGNSRGGQGCSLFLLKNVVRVAGGETGSDSGEFFRENREDTK